MIAEVPQPGEGIRSPIELEEGDGGGRGRREERGKGLNFTPHPIIVMQKANLHISLNRG